MKHLIYILLFCFPLIALPQDGWEEQTSGISSNINNIFFFDATIGFAAGNDGKLIKTTDGGLNWTISSIVSSNNFQKIFFRNATQGYLLTQEGILFTSSNTGETWSSTILDDHGLNGIDFNGDNGVIVGDDGNVFTTSDGSNWTKQNTLGVFTINDVVFFDDTTVVAVGAGGGLYKSSDKGITWNDVFTGSNSAFSAISVLNSTTLLMAGTNGSVLEYEPLTGLLTNVAVGLSDVSLRDISCNEKDVCQVVGYNSTVLIRNLGTWVKRNMDDAVNLNTVQFVNATNVFVGGIAGVIYKHEAAGFPNSVQSVSSKAIKVYPVPCDDFVTIELPIVTQAQIIITSSLGQIVNSFHISGDKTVVDVGGLSTGVYFVKILFQGQATLKKIIVK